MKTYTVLYAEDVPHYGAHDIKAENDQAAIAAAAALHQIGGVSLTEANWRGAFCARIVHIADPDGNLIEVDRPLDDYFVRRGGRAAWLLCEVAADLFTALKKIADTPLYGEQIADEERKQSLAMGGEYDLEGDEYTPSGDTEYDQLHDVVEIARAAVAAMRQSGSDGGQP
jgi:hypothetical protein